MNACYNTLHRGLSCSNYRTLKLKTGMKYSAKLCIFFSLIPNLLTSVKKLHKLETWKTIVTKFIKAVLFYGFMASLPSFLLCALQPLTKSSGQLMSLTAWTLGFILSFAVESPYRHAQLFGFYFPRAFNIFMGLLRVNGFPEMHEHIDKLVICLAIIVVAIQGIRDMNKKIDELKRDGETS